MKALIAAIVLVSSVNVSAATELLFNSLTNALEVSTQQGSLTRTKRIGRDVECVRDSAIVISYSCGLKIDDTGAVVK